MHRKRTNKSKRKPEKFDASNQYLPLLLKNQQDEMSTYNRYFDIEFTSFDRYITDPEMECEMIREEYYKFSKWKKNYLLSIKLKMDNRWMEIYSGLKLHEEFHIFSVFEIVLLYLF